MAGGFRRPLTVPQFEVLLRFNWNDAAELAELQKAVPKGGGGEELRDAVAARLEQLEGEEDAVVAVRSHRKLNIKQLVTLTEVYWDDTGKLVDLLEDLRSRLEPEADALLRSVARRIDLLKTDPERAKAERPPSAAAAAPAAADETAAAEPAGEPKSRRKVAAVIAAAAAAAVAAWMLWPHPKDREAEQAAESGIEVLAQGERPQDRANAPAGATTPATTAQRATVSPSDKSPRDGSVRSGDGTVAAAPEKQTATVRSTREPGGRASKDEPDLEDVVENAKEALAKTPRTREPPAAKAAGVIDKMAAPAAPAGRPGAVIGAEAGMAIDDALLACYRTDSNPAACAKPLAAGAASPSAAASPRVASRGGDGATPSSPSSSPSDNASATGGRAPQASSPAASPPGPPSGRGSTGASSPTAARGSASPEAGAGGASSVRGTKTSSGPGGAGGGGGAQTAASQVQQPPGEQAIAQAPPDCPPAPDAGRVVFILDGSVSMGLPLDVDGDLEDQLDEGIRRRDPEARRQYRALLAERGPKRITRARDAFATAVSDLPSSVDLGLVVFQECRDIRKVGIFEAARRGAAIDYIRAMIPKGRTPLADSLRRAAEMLGPGKSSIVMLTDGREFCDGDPCAAAAEIQFEHPGTPIHVIDITGQAKAECIAEATGGRSYKPEAADDLARVIRSAFRGADPQCMAPAKAADADPGKPQ